LALCFVPVPEPITTCVPKVNSLNCTSMLVTSGTPSLSLGEDLSFQAYGMVPNSIGLVLFGSQFATLPFGGGMLCVAGSLRRSAEMSTGPSGAFCQGNFALTLSKAQLAQIGGAAGSTFFAQAWYRDPGFPAPNDLGLSVALSVTLWP